MRKISLLMVWLLLFAIESMAQITQVTGFVLDEADGSPIIGATIRILGTSIGTATDVDGKFVLKGFRPSDKQIEVSYIGYETKVLDAKPDMKIFLKEKAEVMDEVIVVAFGKQKRESFTGSAGVIKKDELAKRSVSNPVVALNGQVAGVQMLESNSLAGDPTITIRGIGSINAGSSPLIIVDGLPYNGYMSDLNPADIENITVLKDAASNALYGARGANGVIMITTKNPERGNTKVTFDARWGVNHDANIDYEMITEPGEYYELHYKAMYNYYLNGLNQASYDAHINANNILKAAGSEGGLGYMVYAVPDGEYLIGDNGKLNPRATLGNRVYHDGKYYTLLPDDWKKYGIRNGFRQEYTLGLSGGSDRYSFYGSLGYLNNEGIVYGSDLKRVTARLKTEYQAYSFLRVGANAGFTHTESNNRAGAFTVVHGIAPIYPLFIRDGEGEIMTDARGKLYDYGDGGNGGMYRPYTDKSNNSVQADLLNRANSNSNAFNIQGWADFTFLKDFKLTINGSAYVTEVRQVTASQPYYGINASSGGATTVGHYRTYDLNFQQLLNYNHSFGLHTVSALVGHEYSRTDNTTLWGQRQKIAMYLENTELAGATSNIDMTSYISRYNVEGYFLRAQYDYDNTYFFSASYRRDGSSRFHPDHRWGNFWSVGGAWILTREEWFPQSALSMLKFKISYGEQGNDNIGNFRYTDTYTIESANNVLAYVFNTKGNSDISWEKAGNFNTGFEFEFFKGRMQGGIEYYNRKTSDMLMYFTVPQSLGYNGYYDNVGDMVNRGFEAELSGSIIAKKNVTWSLNANASYQKNEVTYLPTEKKTTLFGGHQGYNDGNFFVGEGLPLNTWRMKSYAGVNSEGLSQWYYTDADGNKQVTTDYSQASYYECGTALPKVFGGFGTVLNLYGFDLSASFIYSFGGKKIDYGYKSLMAAPDVSGTGWNYHKDVYNSWSAENPNSDIPRWQYGDNNANAYSDRWLTDASYLTFKNLSVGYTVPSRLTNQWKIAKLRVYATCDNVFYWTKRKGFDPRSVSTATYGTSYFPIRTISGGLSIQF